MILISGDGCRAPLGKALILHPPKTGGTWVGSVMEKCCETRHLNPVHASCMSSIDEAIECLGGEYYLACLVRHPAAWLTSCWNHFHSVIDQVDLTAMPAAVEFKQAMELPTLDGCFEFAAQQRLCSAIFTEYLRDHPRLFNLEKGLLGLQPLVTLTDAAYCVWPANVRRRGKSPSDSMARFYREREADIYRQLGY